VIITSAIYKHEHALPNEDFGQSCYCTDNSTKFQTTYAPSDVAFSEQWHPKGLDNIVPTSGTETTQHARDLLIINSR
jgi:hypothetical protein